jgi:hypothetical protein
LAALLDGVAAVVGGVQQLGGQTLHHGAVVAATGSLDQPADGESLAALGADLDGDLVGRAADAAGADLDRRGDVVEGGAEHLDRVGAGAALDEVEGTVHDPLSGRLLALVHDGIHELGEDDVAVLGVRDDLALLGRVTTGHFSTLENMVLSASRRPP